MNFWLDFKYALRLLVNNPGFTALTTAVMACGLGLCVYMFSFINTTFLRPLPFDNGERMVVIDGVQGGVTYNGGTFSMHDYVDVKAQANSYETLGIYSTVTANVSGGDQAVRFEAVVSGPELFRFTGVAPIKGRLFNEDDNQPGANLVAVIGYEMWQNYFGGREDILGYRFFSNGEQAEVIGVMPENYRFPINNSLWMPMRLDIKDLKRGEGYSVALYGLLKEGVSMEQANFEVVDIMKRLEHQYPELNSGTSAKVSTFMESFMGDGSMPILYVMVIAVSFVLLLACTNVGNLLMARASERAKETAIRVALGAPRGRLVMQMLWESLLICLLGGVFGLLLAAWGLEVTNDIMPSFVPDKPPFWWEIQLDIDILLITLGMVAITAIITGLLPAWKTVNGNVNEVLRDGTRGALGRKAGRLSRTLVIFEVALSCTLLTMAAMMAYAINYAMDIDYGADTTGVLTARVGLPEADYAKPEQQLQFYQALMTEMASMPGVSGVGAATSIPANYTGYSPIQIEGQEQRKDGGYPRANSANIYPGTFETLKVKLLQGRMFAASDNLDSEKVVLVSESFVKQHWPNDPDVIGKRIRWVDEEQSDWFRVIGVVEHVIHGQPFAPGKYRGSVYRSYLQLPSRFLTVVARTRGDANALAPSLVKAVASVDANLPAYWVKPMAAIVYRNTAGMSFVSTIFNLFALAAILLAASGIYGVMANAINQRTQELGVRRALGAADNSVIMLLMKQGWWQLLVGTIVGLPIAYFLGNQVVKIIGVESNGLYGVFVAIPLLIAAVVSLATLIPALKAVRLEPSTALRYE